jgi:predicted O-methyltransferase YrrM
LFAVNRLLDRIVVPAGDLGKVRLSLTPVTYYSSLQSRRWLEENPDLWRREIDLENIDWNIESQFSWLEDSIRDYIGEVDAASLVESVERRGIRFRFGPIEAEVLHCMVRSLAPSSVLELGSGASTAVMSDAAALNLEEGRGTCRIRCVDPFATDSLLRLEQVEVTPEYGQLLPVETFEALEPGDILFIDSSHNLKAGSELVRIYLEGIPALAPGVYIHVHDVFLPYAYRPEVLSDFWDFQETALLTALLIGNPRLEVLGSLSAMHQSDPERLVGLIPDFVPGRLERGIAPDPSTGNFPSSIWLKTTER